MRAMKLLVLIALVGLATSSCRSPALRVENIPIARDATFDLLPPSALGKSVSLEQIVEARAGEREFSFHCLLEVEPKRLVLVGMTPFNTRAFTIELADDELSIDIAPGAQLPAEPSRILADLQLALWPEPEVRGLERSELLGDCGFGGLNRLRTFGRGKEPVIVVLYAEPSTDLPWAGRIELKNLERRYTLQVTTVRAEELAP